MDPNKYCQQKVLIPGSMRYYSLLFLEKEKKTTATALYAFYQEISGVIDKSTDHSVTQIKLNWWHEEIQRLFLYQARHPVTQALQNHLDRYSLNQEYFEEIINAFQLNLEYNSYKTFDDLFHYCYRSTSIFELLLAEIFSYETTNIQEYTKHLGLAFSLNKILLNIRNDAMKGRVYIPLDELENFNLKPTDFEKPLSNEDTTALFSFQTQRIKECYKNAHKSLYKTDRYKHISNIIYAQLNHTLLSEIEKDGFKLLQQQLKLNPIRMLWISWNTNRKEKCRHKK